MEKSGGDEVGGFEYLEVALGGVVAFGAVDDGLGGGVPGDFLEREGMAQQIFDKAFAADCVVSGHGFFAAVVDIEAGVFPGEEVGDAGFERSSGQVIDIVVVAAVGHRCRNLLLAGGRWSRRWAGRRAGKRGVFYAGR